MTTVQPRAIRYGVRDEYKPRFGRQVLTLWTGPFSEQYEGYAWELPKRDGYMVRLDYSEPVKVLCPTPRDEETYVQVDAAINAALNNVNESKVGKG